MKKIIYTFLISFFVFANTINAQEDTTTFDDKDTFTYERLDVLDKEEGDLSLTGDTEAQHPDSETSLAARRSSDSGIGETPGRLSVSLTGGANYDIPIAVPPGINGIVPEVFLSYNSQSGNGVAGYGWNISGVSTISRIPASKFHDNQIDGVDFDSFDRFALDGERLILKSGTYGANGAQYDTEKHSNLRITSHGTSSFGASYGPAYFVVKYPDGSIARYGDSDDSLSRLTYAITYWENPQGVRISYEYTNSSSYNNQSISKIKYGGLNSNAPINEIRFLYKNRTRKEQAYVNNHSLSRTDILKSIEIYGNGAPYRSYTPGYSSTKLNYSRLSSMSEYSGDGTLSHSPIYFNYSTSNPSVHYDEITTNLGFINIEQRNSETVPLDLTGNGKMDFIVYPKNNKNKFWMFYNIDPNGLNYPWVVNTGVFEAIFPSTLLKFQNKVFSGQGLTIVQKSSGNKIKFKVYSKAPPSTGIPIGYDYTKTWNSPTYTYQNTPTSSSQKRIPQEYVSGDFNGDGLTDVLAIGKPYTSRTCYEYDCQGDNDFDDDCLQKRKNSKNDPFSKHTPMETKSVNEDGKNIESFRPPDFDCDDDDGGSNKCYSCYNYSVNYKQVHFINLRSDVTSNFATSAGNLQIQLSGAYKLYTGDFNGDGKTDLMHVIDRNLYVYSLDNNNNLSLLWKTTDYRIKLDKPFLLGDYNGDGKTDFLHPRAVNSGYISTFISTGSGFDSFNRTQPFIYRTTNWNGNNGVLTGYNLIPVDINGDGKTDIIDYTTVTHNENSSPWLPPPPQGTQTVKIYNNLGPVDNQAARIKFTHVGAATKTGNLKHFPIPILLNSNQSNKNLEFASISNKWVTNFNFGIDHREDVLLRSIDNNGVRQKIQYNNLDPEDHEYSDVVYEPSYDETYPNIDLQVAPGSKVVSKLERISAGTPTLKQLYSYKGAVYNAEGLGFLGFKGIARSNWHSINADKIFTVSKYDPQLRSGMTEQYSMRYYYSFTTPTSNYISKTTYQYSSSLSTNKVFKLWIDSSVSENKLQGTTTTSSYLYDAYNNPKTITTNNAGGSRIQNIEYYNNNTANNYYIGRLKRRTTNSNVGSETFSTEEKFIYTGSLLTQKQIKGNGTPFDVELYDYDIFGNLIKKTITPNGESSREIEFEYDPSGRFLKKSVDVENLETTYQYDSSTGVLKIETNPFGHETNYEYDSWNRQIKVIDYLGKENLTSYIETNNYYAITDTADDGSGGTLIYDPLKRISKIKDKNVLGQWVSVSHQYDALDRLIKKSEPYTGNSPSQWNTIEYDVYSRPVKQTLHTGRVIDISYSGLSMTVDDGIKTVTTVKDDLGNTASVTDPGGTINYNYYGNGNLKTANYNGVIVATEQDGWGRKTKLTDPSAGTYEYDYNGFGELITETTPKGTTTYSYTPVGKLNQKTIVGDNTNMSTLYAYDPNHTLLSTISVTNSDGNNSQYTYSYDNYKRLQSISETNPYAHFSEQYTYDAFGRIETEQYDGKLVLNNKTSSKKIKNVYQNGVLKTIKDYSTNTNIWNLTGINARGQLTTAAVGTHIIDSRTYNTHGYITNKNVSKNTGGTPATLMQLTTDFNVQRGTLNSRNNSMFTLSETFGYDSQDRLITFGNANLPNSHDYDDFGRITTNNTVGDYSYTGTSYQVDEIELNTQGDLYYQQNKLEKIKYNAFKKPFEIHEKDSEKIGFQYNVFNKRSSMFYGDTQDDITLRNNQKHYTFSGHMELSYDATTGTTTFVTYIGGDPYTAPAIWRSEHVGSGATNGYYYLHRDYLGSIMLITDANGNAKEKRHFDAWGNIVKLTDGANNTLEKLTFLDRGYTGHEHLQGVGLIHMNGRLYDPKLRRFLAPDNYIQDLGNTQNFNRYGYVLNNPLMYTDPSGESYECPECLTPEQQTAGGNLLASIVNSLDGTDFRPFRNWVGNNFQSAVSDFNDGWDSAVDFVKGWFKKPSQAPVEYANYEGLSSDPLAGPSTNIPPAFFNGAGALSNLGVQRGDLQGRQEIRLINPTGMGVRNDTGGDGHWNASRGNRLHKGIDLSSVDGQNILSPIDGKAINSSFVNRKGITIPTIVIIPTNTNLGFNKLEILYTGPIEGGWRPIKAGDVIGQSVNLQELGYPSNVGAHIHLQMKLNKTPVNPSPYFGF